MCTLQDSGVASLAWVERAIPDCLTFALWGATVVGISDAMNMAAMRAELDEQGLARSLGAAVPPGPDSDEELDADTMILGTTPQVCM